jgi:hypothetical protein
MLPTLTRGTANAEKHRCHFANMLSKTPLKPTPILKWAAATAWPQFSGGSFSFMYLVKFAHPRSDSF